MEKRTLVMSKCRIVAIVVAMAVAFAGFSFVEANPVDAAKKYISKNKAVNIALKHAGFKKSQVYDIDVDMDYEKGRYIYEVDFDKGSKEYNYDINAKTGKIIKAPKKSKKKSKNISRAQALKIALKNAKVKRSQVFDVDIEKDYEWGRWIYEVNFQKGMYEYDYDIAVKGGKILHKSIEYDD